jgi:hypothetical protein
MSLVSVLAVGAVWGAVAGWVAYQFFPPTSLVSAQTEPRPKPETSSERKVEDNPSAIVLRPGAVDVTVSMSPLIPDPNQKPASPDDLEFYFFAFISAAAPDHVQFADVTVTNRSPKKMHLETWAQVDYWKDNGEPGRHGWKAEWNPEGLKERTGQSFIDLDAWETKKARVVVFLDEPPEGISRWFVDGTESVRFEIFDSVSGKRIAFNPAKGYPAGQMLAPLPTAKQLMSPEFPELESTSEIPALDAIVRTRNLGYDETNVGMEALIKNSSPTSMELEVGLLIRSSGDATIWAEVPGVLKEKEKGKEKDKGKADEVSRETKVLTIEPGETLVRRMVFDLAPVGYIAKKGWSLSESPKDTLLQINDLKSGKKVWCAFNVGYPPGCDMRGATIIENPQVNSTNPGPNDANDSK